MEDQECIQVILKKNPHSYCGIEKEQYQLLTNKILDARKVPMYGRKEIIINNKKYIIHRDLIAFKSGDLVTFKTTIPYHETLHIVKIKNFIKQFDEILINYTLLNEKHMVSIDKVKLATFNEKCCYEENFSSNTYHTKILKLKDLLGSNTCITCDTQEEWNILCDELKVPHYKKVFKSIHRRDYDTIVLRNMKDNIGYSPLKFYKRNSPYFSYRFLNFKDLDISKKIVLNKNSIKFGNEIVFLSEDHPAFYGICVNTANQIKEVVTLLYHKGFKLHSNFKHKTLFSAINDIKEHASRYKPTCIHLCFGKIYYGTIGAFYGTCKDQLLIMASDFLKDNEIDYKLNNDNSVRYLTEQEAIKTNQEIFNKIFKNKKESIKMENEINLKDFNKQNIKAGIKDAKARKADEEREISRLLYLDYLEEKEAIAKQRMYIDKIEKKMKEKYAAIIELENKK